jgi:hypothetical protein
VQRELTDTNTRRQILTARHDGEFANQCCQVGDNALETNLSMNRLGRSAKDILGSI